MKRQPGGNSHEGTLRKADGQRPARALGHPRTLLLLRLCVETPLRFSALGSLMFRTDPGSTAKPSRPLGHGGRALSHRAAALRPSLLPRCSLPSVTFLGLVSLLFQQAEYLDNWGRRELVGAACAGTVRDTGTRGLCLGGARPCQPSSCVLRPLPFACHVRSSLCLLPVHLLAHTWRLDTRHHLLATR